MSTRQIASFLDPRYKDFEHETVDAREEIQTQVKHLINEMSKNNRDVEIVSSVTNNYDSLEFLYGYEVNRNTADSTIQFQNYLAEPQLRFDFDPLEWWSREGHIHEVFINDRSGNKIFGYTSNIS